MSTGSLFDLPFEDEPGPGAPEPPANGPAAPDRARITPEPPLPPPDPSQSSASTPPADTTPSPANKPSERRRIFTVSEITSSIRVVLEGAFDEVWIEGELSNCRLWNTGHLYLTLKDKDAQLKGIMFKSAYRHLKFKPEDGLRVIARGRLTVYGAKGEYQLVCEHLQPAGLGALQLAFEQRKQKLAAEGLFDAARKRPLPVLPRKIGVVTSLDGAAIRDIIQVLRRRYANAHIVVRPSRVQGDGAAADVARAIRAIGGVAGVDVIIVGRGGGSIEDLWAFNEEPVARAIAASPVPVISAVGHETDFTIADFVADVRAPTPSAAAEIVVSRKDDFCARLSHLGDRLEAVARGQVHRLAARVHGLQARPGFAGFRGRVLTHVRHASDLRHDLRRVAVAGIAARTRQHTLLRQRLELFDVRRRLGAIRMRLVAQDGRLEALVRQRHHRADVRLHQTAGRLASLSPLAVLGRGYAVCWNADRTAIVRDAEAVRPGDDVRVTLARGELSATVRKREA